MIFSFAKFYKPFRAIKPFISNLFKNPLILLSRNSFFSLNSLILCLFGWDSSFLESLNEFFSSYLCSEMNCDDSARAIFLSHGWMSRRVCRTRKSPHKQRNYSQLKERRRTTCAQTAQLRESPKQHAPQERRGTLNRRQPRDQKQAHSPFCVILKNMPLRCLLTTTHA